MTTLPPITGPIGLHIEPSGYPMAALYASLAKAQGAFLAIEKNRDVTITPRQGAPFSFRYADLQEILTKTRPALSENGLALLQTIEAGNGDSVLVCRLVHASGAELTSSLPLPSIDRLGDVKQFGGAITYLRRYLVTSMLGVAADDDLDENGQGAGEDEGHGERKPAAAPAMPQRRSAAPAQQAQAQAPAQAPAASPAPAPEHTGNLDPAPCTAGERAYLMKKVRAKGWTLVDACNAAGLEYIDDEAQLTKGYFAAIKAVV